MENNFKRFLSLVVALVMVFGMMPMSVFATEGEAAEPITGTITEDVVWNDGDIIGGVTISGNVKITVNGTVTVNGTIRLSPDAVSNVTFEGGKLIRGEGFTGQMFYAEGVSGNYQNLTFNNMVLDGGAVWTGDVDETLNRGTVNEGVKATGSVLYLVYANAELNNSTLQNHDDSTGEKANAVFLRYYSTIEFNDSVVCNNSSTSTYYSGGVITVRQGGTVKTNNAEVYGNKGANGGFYGTSSTGSYGGKVEVSNSKFHNNYATNGAVFDMQCNAKVGYLMIDNCEFYDNASNRGLIYEHAYSRPVIIKDSYFHDNECAVWDCHVDPVLDLSGKIVVEEDAEYSKYLFETPIGVGGALAEEASISLSDASYKKLMEMGYLMTEVPTDNYYNPQSQYTIVVSDMEKLVWNKTENLLLIKTDMDGNGMLDVAPAAAATTTNVNLYENFLMGSEDESNRLEVQAVSDLIKNIPIAVWFHEGFAFTGWATETAGAIVYSNTKNAATYAEGTNLYATWKLQTLELKLSRADASDPYCNTLKVTINNENTEGYIDYSYQWYKDGVAIEGATSDEYTIEETATYKCVVTANAAGFDAITAEIGSSVAYKEAPDNTVAMIEETGDKYESLAEAIDAANGMENATVVLLKDVTLGEKLTVSGNVTIEGNYTITRDDAYTGTLFTVNAGATLTLDGGLVIDGGNNYKFDSELYAADMADWNTVIPESDAAKWFTPEEGAPVATAFMMTTTGGTINLNKVTVQNNYSNNSGVISAGANSTITLTGAKVTHVANVKNSGLVANVSGANINVTINEGTVIDGNHVGGNHGLFKIYSGATLTMNGGEITNNTGWNSNGVAVGVYWGTFYMNGGLICSNSSVYGPSNGRNAAVYLHSGHNFKMTGGTICHNSGRARGGIDAPYNNGTTVITGGNVYENVSRGNWPTYDVLGTDVMEISGGWYSQDVTEYVADGYYCIREYNEELQKELYHVVDHVVMTVTMDNKTMVLGNAMPEFTYTISGLIEGDEVMVVVDIKDIEVTAAGEYDITAEAYAYMNDKYVVKVIPGKLTVLDAVAESNGVYYNSIQAALNAATKGVQTTVTVLKDHEVDVNVLTYGYPVLVNAKNIVLDLNGKVVTFDYEKKTVSGVIYASIRTANGAKLKILDSSAEKTGTLYNKGSLSEGYSESEARIIWLTTGCSLEIESGRFISDQKNTMFYASNSDKVNPVNFYVKGGYFEQNGITQAGHYDCFNREDVPGDEFIELTGGTFAHENPENGRQNDWEITIPEGYTVVYNGVGADGKETWTVTPCVTVTFDNQAMAQGSNVPELTYSINYNYVPKDAVNVVVDPTAIENPTAGEKYVITGTATLTDGTGKAENYAVVVVPGELVVGTEDAVAYNVQDALFFDDLSDALDVADSGETVQLLKKWHEDLLLVPADVTFDLNGNVVSAYNALSFGAVMDGKDAVGGIEIDCDTTKAFTKLQPVNGGYLPIYDTAAGMYKFFAFEVQSNKIVPGDNSVTFAMRVVFDNDEAYNVLANTTESCMDFYATMSWTGINGFDIRYKMTDGNVKAYAKAAYNQIQSAGVNNKAMTLKVTGVDKLGAGAYISAAPSVITVAEVTASADALVYNIG